MNSAGGSLTKGTGSGVGVLGFGGSFGFKGTFGSGSFLAPPFLPFLGGGDDMGFSGCSTGSISTTTGGGVGILTGCFFSGVRSVDRCLVVMEKEILDHALRQESRVQIPRIPSRDQRKFAKSQG